MKHELVPEFIHSLEAYMYPDPNGNGSSGYRIYSVYCDSPDLSLFWDKIEGFKFRRKVRFRRYGNGKDVFLEIKQRIDGTLQKRRALFSLDKVVENFGYRCNGSGVEDEISSDPVASEVLYLWRHYEMRPNMAISYRRQAFFAIFEPDLRITFDTHVQYHARDVDISQPFEVGKYLVEPNMVIMEIKFSDWVPLWLCRLVCRYELKRVRLSKYCTAVDREYFNNTLT